MDFTERKITKIAREVNRLTVKMMKEEGIGSGEFDLIHWVRYHPGISQKEICQELNMDKGAAAKRVANLQKKGYLTRKVNPEDGRSQLIFATEKAEGLKLSKTSIEATFYEWLLEEVNAADRETFLRILDDLYWRSKRESRSGFPHVMAALLARQETN